MRFYFHTHSYTHKEINKTGFPAKIQPHILEFYTNIIHSNKMEDFINSVCKEALS